MAGFSGLRGSEDFVADARPKSWREGILRQSPNGMASLTGLSSRMKSERVDDPEFYWWTKTLAARGGAQTEQYDSPALSSARTATNAVADQIIYIKLAESVAKYFVIGQVAESRIETDYRSRLRGKIVDVQVNGANSYVAFKLYEAENASYPIKNHTYLEIIGNVNPEGGEMPIANADDPVKLYNYTQIFRNALDITRTAKKTHLRTGDAYKEAKMDCLMNHGRDIEWSAFFGKKTLKYGNNGKPERTSDGLIQVITDNAPANVSSFAISNPTLTWAQGGWGWLKDMLEVIFRYGDGTKACYCGTEALMGLMAIAEQMGTINIEVGQKSFGLNVRRVILPVGELELVTHPLFSFSDMHRRMMVIFDPTKMRWRYIDDTQFIDDKNARNSGTVDGTKEEYLTEGGFEFHFPNECGVLYDVGQDGINV